MKNVRAIKFSRTDWANIFKYLCTPPRQVKEVGGPNIDGRLRDRYSRIQVRINVIHETISQSSYLKDCTSSATGNTTGNISEIDDKLIT